MKTHIFRLTSGNDLKLYTGFKELEIQRIIIKEGDGK